MALINSMGALGSFVGAYVVGYLNGVTGGFGASYILKAGSLLLAAAHTLWAVRAARKDKLSGRRPDVVYASEEG
jgi:hypothetical protein